MGERPVVTADPAVSFGRAAVKGISAEAIGDPVWAGESLERVGDDFNLTRTEVLVACWYLGAHGSRGWRRRWRDWAGSVHGDLAHGRYEVPDPPVREEKSSG